MGEAVPAQAKLKGYLFAQRLEQSSPGARCRLEIRDLEHCQREAVGVGATKRKQEGRATGGFLRPSTRGASAPVPGSAKPGEELSSATLQRVLAEVTKPSRASLPGGVGRAVWRAAWAKVSLGRSTQATKRGPLTGDVNLVSTTTRGCRHP